MIRDKKNNSRYGAENASKVNYGKQEMHGWNVKIYKNLRG